MNALDDRRVRKICIIDRRKDQSFHKCAKHGTGIAAIYRRSADEDIRMDDTLQNGLKVIFESADALLAALEFAGKTAHAAFVVQASVVKIDALDVCAGFFGALHRSPQELRGVFVLSRAAVNKYRFNRCFHTFISFSYI